MRNLSSLFLVFCCLVFIVLGCGGSVSSPEVRARQDFANKISESYPFRVSFSAQGKEREILDIAVIEEVSAYSASGTVEMIVTDKLKRDAKALNFTQIVIKGGRKSFGEPDTINKTIPLR